MKIYIILVICFCFYFYADAFEDPYKPKEKFQKIVTVPNLNISKVHIIFMNHLDVGFSDGNKLGFIGNVLNSYFHVHFPNAIKLANQLRSGGFRETFRYTTHPWLLDLYSNCPPNFVMSGIKVKCPSPTELQTMSDAIRRRDVVWHAGAMNIQYELYNRIGLNMTLDVSARLDKEFGFEKKFRVVSLRDVPGLTQGVIPGLVANNIMGITSGVNVASAPPDVPPMFRWRQAPPGSQEVIFLQNRGGYPANPGPDPNHPGGLAPNQCFQAPKTTELLCFAFNSDNLGPPTSITELLRWYSILQGLYPKANLVASNLEEFFALVSANREELPVVTGELGDTWMEGCNDLRKMTEYQAISHIFADCFHKPSKIPDVTCDMSDRRLVNASRYFIKLAEHTWGLATHIDTIHYTNKEFELARNHPNYLNAEASWIEQRLFVNFTVEALQNHPVRKVIQDRLTSLRTPTPAGRPDLHNYEKISNLLDNQTCNGRILRFGQNGSIVYMFDGIEWATPNQSLAELTYRTYNETDNAFFERYYHSPGMNVGMGRPNSTINAHPESKIWPLTMLELYRDASWGSCTFVARIESLDPKPTSYYGMPESFWISYDWTNANEVNMEVMWFNKKPTRLLETIYVTFRPAPALEPGHDWFLSKIGSLISPHSVVKNGSQWQHGVDDDGVFLQCSTTNCGSMQILSPDYFMVAPVTANYGPTVWPAPLEPITDKIVGMSFPLFNNLWNWNYISWYPFRGPGTQADSEFHSRYTLRLHHGPMDLPQSSSVDNTLRFKPATRH